MFPAAELPVAKAWAAARQKPRWVPDSEAATCMCCAKKFKRLTRRHHCRYCGWVVCNGCSSGTAVLQRWLEDTSPHAVVEARSSKPLRVCDGCLAAVSASDGTATPAGGLAQADLEPEPEPDSEPPARLQGGGGEVVLGGRTFPVSDGGVLYLRSQKLGPREVAELARWVATPAGAVLTSLRCGNNPGMVGQLYSSGNLKTPDVHAEVFKQLCDSLRTSQVTEVDFSCTGIGLVCVNYLIDWVRDATANIVSVNCLANHFGDEGLATLLTAIEGTSVRSLCGLTEGQTTVDFSGQNLSPIDCKILAAEYDFRGFIATVTRVSMLSNPIGDGADALIEVFAQNDQIQTLLGIEQGVEVLDLSGKQIQIDPGQVKILAAEIRLSKFMALTSILLDGQPISGTSPKGGHFNWGIDGLDADLSGFKLLCDAMASSQIEIISMQSCYLGVQALTLLTEATKIMAALTSINCLHNPLGEGLQVIIKAFEETPRLRTLCGLEEGIEKIDWSDSGKGPIEVALLAANLKAGRAAAALNSLKCGNNPGMVGELEPWGELKTPDAHAEIFKQLTDGLNTSKVTEADFSACGLGPVALGHLSEWVRDATAVLNSLTVDSIRTLGSQKTYRYTLTVGEDTLELSQKNLGSADVALLAAWLQRPEVNVASVEGIKLDGNPIGYPSKVSLKPGAETGVDVEEGVFVAVDGRWGKIRYVEPYCSIRWLDDHTEQTELVKFDDNGRRAVASRANFVEEHAHIQALGKAISGSKVQQLSLVDCKFTSATLTTFVQSVNWETAAVADLNISEAIIGDAGATLVEAISSSSTLNCITIGEGLRLPLKDNYDSDILDASDKGIEPGGVAVIAWWLTTSVATASVKVIKMDGNPIGTAAVTVVKPEAETGVDVKKGVFAAVDNRFGEVLDDPDEDQELMLRWLDDGNESDYIKVDNLTSVVASRADLFEDRSHIRALGESLSEGKVKQISLVDTQFSSATLTEFVQSVRWETTVIARLVLSRNPITDHGDDLSGLKALCKVLPNLKIPISLELANCISRVAEVNELAQVIQTGATMNLLTIDSTGTNGRKQTYSLTAGEDTINLSGKNLGPADVKLISIWIASASADIKSLDLSGCGLTGATYTYDGYAIGGRWSPENIDSNMDGFIALCSVLGQIRTVRLADSHLGGASAAELTKMVVSPRTGSITESIDLSGCAIDPTSTAQLLSAASETSRLRLRNAQVLAFSTALHDRLGADCVIQCHDMIVDVWCKVAEDVRGLHGHEVLCSQLASHQPWYEMRVRGLIAEGMPGQ